MSANAKTEERQRPAELPKVLFDERMVMIRHLVNTSDRELAEYLFRTMLEQCKYLSRKHGLSLGK